MLPLSVPVRLIGWLALTVLFFSHATAKTRVDLELVLAVDVSHSMDRAEQQIQRDGYIAAFRHRDVVRAILTGPNRRIAVTYLEWGDADFQTIVVPWRIIGSAHDAHAFAYELTRREISQARRTSISDALRVAASLIGQNDIAGLRRIIDVSGDGPNNQGYPVAPVRDAVVRQGIVVNGLPFVARRPDDMSSFFSVTDIDKYYEHCVIGGPGAFIMRVRRKQEFKVAIRRKLVQEIAGKAGHRAGRPLKAKFARTASQYDCLVGEKLWEGFQKE